MVHRPRGGSLQVDVEQLSDAIGANVRRYRAALGLSQDALADAADLSKGTVVAIEQQRANPSVATLCSLAEALGVGLQSLLERPTGPLVKVRRAQEAVELWQTDAGSRAVLLLGTDPPGSVELWRWELQPGDAFDGTAHPHGTIESLLVESGGLHVDVAGVAAELGPGDSVSFEAHVAHGYATTSDGPASFTMWIRVGDRDLSPATSIGAAAEG
jgi:transcriptional regulator with XRE-family HTH domain